jgi:hypothetical protein
MTSQHDKPKRWRPKFSMSGLLIVTAVIAAFFAGRLSGRISREPELEAAERKTLDLRRQLDAANNTLTDLLENLFPRSTP